MRFPGFFITILSALLLIAPSAIAEDSRTVEVLFDEGANSTTITDQIAGYQNVHYTVRARSGQQITVDLQAENKHIAYFNIYPPGKSPGSAEAIYIGSIYGSQFKGGLPEDGVYLIQVYQMRSAARRNVMAKYKLTITIENHDTKKISSDN